MQPEMLWEAVGTSPFLSNFYFSKKEHNGKAKWANYGIRNAVSKQKMEESCLTEWISVS